MKILILCTGNTCRSQMAHGFLNSFDNRLEVFSAGTKPGTIVNPNAVKVMAELGIDIDGAKSNHVDEYINQPWDFVITVCDGAKEICPVFTGNVKSQIHIGFDDPVEAKGNTEEVLSVYRRVRDEIRRDFGKFYQETLLQQL
ncbi:MAG: arsenate reductase ArsC [Bacteroidales bacterium]|nr:arsenate reductase ArsC [Bacteroidales bacterium]MCF8454476.1 arsenate reductase ArsC [Bacteroidales bacterium]